MLEPIPFAGMVEIDESFDRTASHMAGEYISYNEPVGYYYSNACFDIRDCSEQMKRNGIPLYTHTAKDLTDEEIRHIQAQCHLKNVGYDNFIMRFARAILRKASEK